MRLKSQWLSAIMSLSMKKKRKQQKKANKDFRSDDSSYGLAWYERWLLRIAPRLMIGHMLRKSGVDAVDLVATYKFFGNKRIDLIPLDSRKGRGFLLVLDQKVSLWFFQDGDHFVYDGFEVGRYRQGEVTIFDNLERN